MAKRAAKKLAPKSAAKPKALKVTGTWKVDGPVLSQLNYQLRDAGLEAVLEIHIKNGRLTLVVAPITPGRDALEIGEPRHDG
jgi:hypothetical protein